MASRARRAKSSQSCRKRKATKRERPTELDLGKLLELSVGSCGMCFRVGLRFREFRFLGSTYFWVLGLKPRPCHRKIRLCSHITPGVRGMFVTLIGSGQKPSNHEVLPRYSARIVGVKVCKANSVVAY